MNSIIPPSQFTVSPWKNGLGETIELAISENGTVDSFDWRLSIATVSNDGPFSNFYGYRRCLVLLEGNGIELRHDQSSVDRLDHRFAFARFDGGCKTVGTLLSGPIKDFNIMTNDKTHRSVVNTYAGLNSVKVETSGIVFVYSPTNRLEINGIESATVLPDHLLRADDSEKYPMTVVGNDFIVIEID